MKYPDIKDLHDDYTVYCFVSGNTARPRAWMLSMDGEVVMGPHPDFTTGRSAIFANYYNLHLQSVKMLLALWNLFKDCLQLYCN